MAKRVGILVFCLAIAVPAGAQLVIGQYESEAPLASWNVFGAVGAPALALGGIRIGRALDASVSTTNPALLLSLPRALVSLTGSYAIASLFRWSIVNTGVLQTSSNLSGGRFGLETGSFAYRFGGWAVAFTADILEDYSRPAVRSSYASGGTEVYRIGVEQSGFLRVWNIAAAARFGHRLSFGVGLNLVAGRLERNVTEAWPRDGITITDDKLERFRGVYVNAGLRADLSPSIAVSAAVRTPSTRAADGQSLIRYEASETGTDIRIEAEAHNQYKLPWVAGAGLDWRWSKTWRFAAELTFFGWSRYSVLYFDEPAARRFRNVVTAAAGVEHGVKGRLGRKAVLFPIRLGVAYDPQPMDEVHSHYFALTSGTGIRLGAFSADLSGSIGRESGSGNALWAGRVALGLSYVFENR